MRAVSKLPVKGLPVDGQMNSQTVKGSDGQVINNIYQGGSQ